MDNLITQILNNPALSGQLDTVLIDGRFKVTILNYQASKEIQLNDPVEAGCYITIMGKNNAYSPHFPDYPASAFEYRFMSTVLPESRTQDLIVLPKNGTIQVIRMYSPLEHSINSSLTKDTIDDFFSSFDVYTAGWQFPLSGELFNLVNSIWICPLSGEAREMWMLGKMYEILALAIAQNHPQSLAEKASMLIQQNPESNWTINTLAKTLATNECYLKQAFKREFDMGVATWIQEYRIQQAQRQLTNPLQPVTEIALSLGFQTSSYFSKVFKRHTGVTPTQFRTRNS